jgi:hypothetical protein
VVLSSGTPEAPLWQGEPGRSWLEMLEVMAEFDHRAAVHFDADHVLRKGCRYCRQKRSAQGVILHDGMSEGGCSLAVDWELFTRSELAAGGEGQAPVVELSRPRRTLSATDFANYVVASGQAADGRPVRALVYDAASLYDPEADNFVGWRKMDVRALSTYTTQAEVNRLAAAIFADASQRPERIGAVLPLEPGIRIGHVVLIRGGEGAGANVQKYRVTRVRHNVTRLPRHLATTEALARWIGEEA